MLHNGTTYGGLLEIQVQARIASGSIATTFHHRRPRATYRRVWPVGTDLRKVPGFLGAYAQRGMAA